MPDAVTDYCQNQNLKSVRDIQNQILSDYKKDFSKHVPKDILPKVNIVWEAIPSQLAKENKKIIYRAIKKGARAKDVLVNNNAFTEYKGSFTEQYVLQELIPLNKKIYYYSKENSSLEIDFIMQKESVYPIEVKAEENLRSKSLKAVHETNPDTKPVRFSMAAYRKEEWLTNVPLYLAHEWMKEAE